MEILSGNSLTQRILAMRPGLSVKEAANHLGIRCLKKVRRVLKEHNYIVHNHRKDAKSELWKKSQWKTDWSKVDWSKSNVEIAALTGVSRVSVAKRRKQLT